MNIYNNPNFSTTKIGEVGGYRSHAGFFWRILIKKIANTGYISFVGDNPRR